MRDLIIPILEEHHFIEYEKPGVWITEVQRPDNCEYNLFIQLLLDQETVRLSIRDIAADYYDKIDLFETQDPEELNEFIRRMITINNEDRPF